MAQDGYRWWIERVRRQLHLADLVRIDHFRGFVDYWEIPADEPTAVKGCWRLGPGMALFDALAEALGPLPIIAEDLGIAFSGDAGNAFLPHNFEPNTVVYTGTHDNDTVPGWWAACNAHERAFATHYLGVEGQEVHWAMLRAASFSVARLSLCQFQDVLGLGSEHRMNTPGTLGCWAWRFSWDWVGPDVAQRLANITAASGRVGFNHLRF
jgi:4-alpha-glucanotransferase